MAAPLLAHAIRGRAAPDPTRPTGPRLWLINAVLAGVIAGSLFDIVTFREHWPFSPYWMYSAARRERTLSAMRLFGVTREASPREIPLLDPRFIRPFDLTKLRVAVTRMAEAPGGSARLSVALADCLERYERLRRAGAHDGPPLGAIRLYRLHWLLDPWARNARRPERRELIYEFAAPPAER